MKWDIFQMTEWSEYTRSSLKKYMHILLSNRIIVMGGVVFVSLALAGEQPLKEITPNEDPIQCSERNKDIYKPGYIVLEVTCNEGSSLCGGFVDFIRDRCQGKTLLQRYCDSGSKEFYSTRSIKCEKECKYVRGSGYCLS